MAVGSAALRLSCPDCYSPVEDLRCEGCERRFPVVDNVPVLLPADSIFSEASITGGGFYSQPRSERRVRWRRRLPGLTRDFGRQAVTEAVESASGTGLVVGAGERRSAFRESVRWTITDVSTVHGVDYVADAHRLPFDDESFDVVVAENVLEHTIEPHRVARELERVCRVGGRLVISVPFAFPFHGVPYDFFRCSPVGLRCLFRRTSVESLAAGHGAGGTIAYLATSWVTASAPRRIRKPVYAVSRVLFSVLKYLDRPRLDTAGSFVLIGQRQGHELTGAEAFSDAVSRL